ncbi:hypothetical protein HK099_000517 [Clydaea vesicula]|uniref:FHA domain-containing protein n=1 Tax=Clydaea vesicula TaxID=447962 RepID=A0AAD5U471_9FUNG|nr:hypothetical protein HK099_000517 [Clydaea vesicula]KAJ3386618.1 hypothetical protein HDU92_002381 [Lobulomyces angularis]
MSFFFIPIHGFKDVKEIKSDEAASITNPQVVKLGRLLENSSDANTNLTFHSKVVSRNHALLIIFNGKIFIQDTKSSSGTFLNSQRLSPQQVESSKIEVHDGDIIALGEDCDVLGVIHQCIVFRILFGENSLKKYELNPNCFDHIEDEYLDKCMDNFIDPQVKAIVEIELNAIWSNLSQFSGVESPLERLKNLSLGKKTFELTKSGVLRNLNSGSNSNNNSLKRPESVNLLFNKHKTKSAEFPRGLMKQQSSRESMNYNSKSVCNSPLREDLQFQK